MIIPWFQDNISEKSAVMKKSFKTSCPSPYISFVKTKSGMPKFVEKYTKNGTPLLDNLILNYFFLRFGSSPVLLIIVCNLYFMIFVFASFAACFLISTLYKMLSANNTLNQFLLIKIGLQIHHWIVNVLHCKKYVCII